MGLVDPEYPKYPHLPIFSCRGYEEIAQKREMNESAKGRLKSGGMGS
jgi:hypothetical protein